jgi:GldM C-terminal domain
MKTYLSLLVFNLLSLTIIAQNITIELPEQNVLYTEIDNVLNFSITNIDCKNVTIKTTLGTIKKNGCTVKFKSLEVGLATISFYNRKKKIGERQFRVKDFTYKPIANLGYPVNDSLSIKSINALGGIQCRIDEYCTTYFQVISFSLVIFSPNNCKKVELNNETNRFGDEVKTALLNLAPGDYLFFNNIKTKSWNGKLYDAYPFYIIAK